MMFGYFPAQALHVTVRIGLAERLAGGPLGAGELAAATDCHAGALTRLLRALVVLGVLEQPEPELFALTGTGRLLTAGHPASMRNYVLLFCGEPVWLSWGDLEHSVRTGQSAWERRYGPQFGSGLTNEVSAVFNAAMAEGTRKAAPAVIAAGGFERFGTIADLGGGCGILLAAVLAAHPGLRGMLLDLPRALEGAADVLHAAGADDRCELVPGDFFAAVPGGADAYLLKSVIHDWDDERAGAILANCRAAMAPAASVMLVEPIISDQPSQQDPFSVSFSDLNMLVCTSGRERTEGEFRDLLAAAGFAVRRIVPCPPTGYNLIEARPLP